MSRGIRGHKQLTLYRRLRETMPEVDPKVLEGYVNLADQHDGVTPLVQQIRNPEAT